VPVPALLVQPQQPLQPQALPVPQALPLPRAVPRALPLLPQAQRRSPAIWLGDSQGGSRPGPPRAASASAHCAHTHSAAATVTAEELGCTHSLILNASVQNSSRVVLRSGIGAAQIAP